MVDEADTRRPKALQLALNIVDSVCNVVEARPFACQEATDNAVIEQGPHLHVLVADGEQHALDALLGDRLTVNNRKAERVAVEGERRVQIAHSHADVIDSSQHGHQQIIRMLSPRDQADRAVTS